MPPKLQRNFRIPPELVTAFEGSIPLPEKKRWLLYAAAMANFLRLPPAAMEQMVSEMMNADAFGTVGALVERMKGQQKGAAALDALQVSPEGKAVGALPAQSPPAGSKGKRAGK